MAKKPKSDFINCVEKKLHTDRSKLPLSLIFWAAEQFQKRSEEVIVPENGTPDQKIKATLHNLEDQQAVRESRPLLKETTELTLAAKLFINLLLFQALGQNTKTYDSNKIFLEILFANLVDAFYEHPMSKSQLEIVDAVNDLFNRCAEEFDQRPGTKQAMNDQRARNVTIHERNEAIAKELVKETENQVKQCIAEAKIECGLA